HSDIKNIDQCFLAGLLHDIGRIVLADGLPVEYSKVWNLARQNHLPLWQVEQTEFGATHADVGAYLLGLWGLPNPIVEAVALHHCPSRCIAPGFSPLTAVHVANAFAREKDKTVGSVGIDHEYLAKSGLDNRLQNWRDVCFSEES